MSISTTHAVAVIGVEGFILNIEASAVRGTAGLHLYGLPDATVRETRDRVRAAIINAGLHWPSRQITVGLLPASLPKRGSSFDLAIAVAVLAVGDAISSASLSKVAFVAELGLDGSLRPVRAVASAAMAVAQAGYSTIVVAHANAAEARLLPELQVIAAGDLSEVITWLATGTPPPMAHTPSPVAQPAPKITFPDLADLRLSEATVTALEVAAAGGHHLLLTGRQDPARHGRALLPILPDLDPAAATGAPEQWAGGNENRLGRLATATFAELAAARAGRSPHGLPSRGRARRADGRRMDKDQHRRRRAHPAARTAGPPGPGAVPDDVGALRLRIPGGGGREPADPRRTPCGTHRRQLRRGLRHRTAHRPRQPGERRLSNPASRRIWPLAPGLGRLSPWPLPTTLERPLRLYGRLPPMTPPGRVICSSSDGEESSR